MSSSLRPPTALCGCQTTPRPSSQKSRNNGPASGPYRPDGAHKALPASAKRTTSIYGSPCRIILQSRAEENTTKACSSPAAERSQCGCCCPEVCPGVLPTPPTRIRTFSAHLAAKQSGRSGPQPCAEAQRGSARRTKTSAVSGGRRRRKAPVGWPAALTPRPAASKTGLPRRQPCRSGATARGIAAPGAGSCAAIDV